MSAPTIWPDGPTLAEDPKPAHGSTADVQGVSAGAAADLREELPPGWFPHERLQPQALQLRGLFSQQVILLRHRPQYPPSGLRGVSGLSFARDASVSARAQLARASTEHGTLPTGEESAPSACKRDRPRRPVGLGHPAPAVGRRRSPSEKAAAIPRGCVSGRNPHRCRDSRSVTARDEAGPRFVRSPRAAASCLLGHPGLVVPPWYRLLCPMRPRSRRTGTLGTAGTANGRIYTPATSAGGRAVAGSNPVAPIDGRPSPRLMDARSRSGFLATDRRASQAAWYHLWYQTARPRCCRLHLKLKLPLGRVSSGPKKD